MSFLSVYAALRLTGKKGPRITNKLLKAAGLLVYAAILAPVAILRLLAGIQLTKQPPPPPTKPTGAQKGAFAAHAEELQ